MRDLAIFLFKQNRQQAPSVRYNASAKDESSYPLADYLLKA